MQYSVPLHKLHANVRKAEKLSCAYCDWAYTLELLYETRPNPVYHYLEEMNVKFPISCLFMLLHALHVPLAENHPDLSSLTNQQNAHKPRDTMSSNSPTETKSSKHRTSQHIKNRLWNSPNCKAIQQIQNSRTNNSTQTPQ